MNRVHLNTLEPRGLKRNSTPDTCTQRENSSSRKSLKSVDLDQKSVGISLVLRAATFIVSLCGWVPQTGGFDFSQSQATYLFPSVLRGELPNLKAGN